MTHAVQGRGQRLERNIPPLVAPIGPAINRAIADHPEAHGDDLIPHAIEANVWQAIEDLFMRSPASRDLVNAGKAKVVGAIYDVGTGKVAWLDQAEVGRILRRVETSPDRETEAFAE